MGSVASRWLVPAVVVITGAAVAAGMVGRTVYSRPAEAKGAPAVASSSVAGPVPGSAEVRLSPDSFTHPDRSAVQRVLQTYFDSINARDFGVWRSVVSARRASQAVESTWAAAYESTRDGGMVVQRIESDVPGRRLRVLISFVSTQDVAKAPVALPEPCIRWRVVYVLAWEGGELKVDDAPENRSPQMEKC
ncbi:hypothetical protein SAMN05216188_104137 [Lentzea xinjiangensis]|uniref:Uncharacterized protein n=1 Tax=Lentzea xinjiangensis TaxID=402600 RepID=A0A1H9HPH2_9PSEU|nr:hypothetical protein [Lentzea xinjiangensis]SEQ64230.1 hypothetical protein SAMN05216188_104137 [Lentzea xinjiangensis]